jgi:alcohol dehydrogenase
VLVPSASGGVASAAVQAAVIAGARVIASVGSPAKTAAVEALGAAQVFCYRETPIAQAVRDATAGRGVDVVVEHTGGETFKAAVKATARGGRIVTCGATGDFEPVLNLRYIFWRQIAIMGSTMAPKGRLHRILDLVAARRLRGVVDRVLPLASIADAHRVLEARQAVGKVVLTL